MISTSKRGKRDQRQQGFILGVVLIMVASLSLLGLGLLSIGGADSLEAAKAESKLQAFWNAEAGIEEAKALAWKIRNTSNPVEIFPPGSTRTWAGTTSRGAYTVTITQPIATPPGYLVESRGISPGGRRAGVSVDLLQVPALSAGVFGDEGLGIQPNVTVYSYNSSQVTGFPTPGDSTGEASVGSNEQVDLSPGLTLDGSILLGVGDDDQTAGCDGCELFTVTESPPIDPDPLGIIGGPLEIEFNAAKVVNNNSAVPEISGTSFTVPNSTLVTLPPGDYYLTDILVRGDLAVDGTNGVVNIYLEGPFDSKPGCTINNNGAPTQLRIYSNSTDSVILQPNGTLSALVYAPYSTNVRIKPGDDFYGVVWGANVQLFPGDDVYIDMDLLNYGAFSIYKLSLQNWREFSGS